MIGNHIAQCAGGFVKPRTALDANGFGDRDLDVIDMFAVPEWFENPVRKPHQHNVLDGFLAQEVVHPINLTLGNALAQLAVECLGRLDIVAERLFNHDPTPAVRALSDKTRSTELVNDPRKEPRRNGEVEHDILTSSLGSRIGLQAVVQAGVTGRVAEIALQVRDPR